jgi:phage gp16-like protein
MKNRTANRLAKISPAQIALIHVGKAKLGLANEDYRDILAAHGGGVTTSKDLTPEGFKAVLKHFKACGFKQLYQPPPYPAPEIARLPLAKQGIMYLIGVTLGALDKSWAYADGIAGRMFRIERLEWCDKEQLQKVMAALVYQQKKTGDGGRGKGKGPKTGDRGRGKAQKKEA